MDCLLPATLLPDWDAGRGEFGCVGSECSTAFVSFAQLCKSSVVLFQRHLYKYHRKTRFSARFVKDYQVLKSSGKFENPSSSRVLHRFYSNRARIRSLNPPGVNLYTLRPSLVVALLMFISRCRYRLSLFSTDAPAMVRGVENQAASFHRFHAL